VAVVFLPPSKKKGIAIMVSLIELLPGVGPALYRREGHLFFSISMKLAICIGQNGLFLYILRGLCVRFSLFLASSLLFHIFLKACSSNAIFN